MVFRGSKGGSVVTKIDCHLTVNNRGSLEYQRTLDGEIRLILL